MNNLSALKSFREHHLFLRTAFVNRLACRCSSDSGKKKDNDAAVSSTQNSEKEDESKIVKASSKLNKLLLQMADDSVTRKTKLDLAKPASKKKEAKITPEEPPVNFEKRIQSAARDVAHSLGSDEKRVESELLSKLLNVSSKTNTDTAATLSSIVKGMKIERESKSTEQISRAQQVRQLLDMTKRSDVNTKNVLARPERRLRSRVSIKGNIQSADIFASEPLGLFNKDLKDEGIINTKWRTLHEKELQLAVTHPPSNYFQQMIQWTEAGKIWKFPIDNEQGMEIERSVYFTEHVFLEKHLEPWCPPKGPVRHFMELVCVGLSKNPYMTVETKKEHIEWYQKYFEDKMQLLKEIGAVPVQDTSELSAGTSDK